MNQSPSSVLVAYEMLVEELEAEIDRTNRQGAEDLLAGEHARAHKALGKARAILALR